MIADTIHHAGVYAGLGAGIARALELIRRTDFAALPAGRHEVNGDALYYLVQPYTTRPVEGASWEAHRRYLDVQYVASGRERIGWAPLTSLRVTSPYDAAADAELLAGEGDFITAGPGTFVLLWPEDAHMPGIAAGEPSPVLKVVVKVKL